MKNEEKYRTAEEREEAFDSFCLATMCYKCPCCGSGRSVGKICISRWLKLEAEDEKDGDDLFTVEPYAKTFRVICGKEVVTEFFLSSRAEELCARLNSIAREWHRKLCEKGETK